MDIGALIQNFLQRDPTVTFLSVSLAASLALALWLGIHMLREEKFRALAENSKAMLETRFAEYQNNFAQVRAAKEQLQEELERETEFNAALREQLAPLRQEQERLDRETEELEQQNTRLMQELDHLKQENTLLKARQEALQTQNQADRERAALAARELEARLTELGGKMLKERGGELQQLSREQFRQTVEPLTRELQVFRDLLGKTQKNSSEQAGALQAELKRLQESQLAFSRQAESLTTALRAGGKSQGMWGELQLERVLEASGLTKGVEYLRELSVSSASGGRAARPDAVIRLPEHHCLIIDAKCSLTAYTDLVNADSPQSRQLALQCHLKSLRRHISELAAKRYPEIPELDSPSFVFMFVPVDAALTTALQADTALYDYASRCNIFLTSPAVLIPALRVAADLWKQSRQNENLRKLAEAAQKICDKYSGVQAALEDLRQRHNALAESLETLDRRLLNGRGSLFSQLHHFTGAAPAVLEERSSASASGAAAAPRLQEVTPRTTQPL